MWRRNFLVAAVLFFAMETFCQTLDWIKPGGRISGLTAGGGYLAGNGLSIYLWDLRDRTFIRSLGNVGGSLRGISADGTTLVSEDYDAVHVWSLPGGERFSLPDNSRMRSFDFQTRSNRLGFLSPNGSLRFWDIATRQEVEPRLEVGGGLILKFSPDGERLAIHMGGHVRLYSLSTREYVELQFTGQLRHITFSPDGRWFAAANEWISDSIDPSVIHQVKVWDTESGELHNAFEGHTTSIQSISFAPDNRHLASQDDSGQTFIWNLDSNEANRSFSVADHPRPLWVGGLFYLSDSELSSGNLIYDLDSGAVSSLLHHPGAIHGLSFSPRGSLLVVDEPSEPALRHGDTGDIVFRLSNDTAEAPLRAAALSTIMRMMDPPVRFSADEQTVIFRDRIYDLSSGQIVDRLAPPPASLGPDWYYTSEFTSTNVADLRRYPDGAILRSLTSATSQWSSAIAESPSGGMVATTGGFFHNTVFIDSSIKFWNPADGSLLREIPNGQFRPFRLVFSADEKLLASGSDLRYGELSVFEVDTGRTLLELRDPSSPAIGFDFLPDSRTIVYGNLTGLHFWDAPSGNLITTLTNELFLISAVAISPDGKKIAVGRFDGTILMLDVPVMDRLTLQADAGTLTLGFFGRASVNYLLESSPDLQTWTEVLRVLGTNARVEKTVSPGETIFYRLR